MWAWKLHEGKSALIYPVRTTGLRFVQDPSCKVCDNEVNGYIFVGRIIPPDRLGAPIRVGPPKPG